jgi:hypothetical protein
MELDKNEHSILGFFPSIAMANQAVESLKQAQLVPSDDSVQVDQVSRFGIVNDSEYNNPINNALTLHGITMYSNSRGIGDGSNALLAVNDTEAGRGINNNNLAGEESFMVTLVTSQENVEQAVALMKASGGRV